MMRHNGKCLLLWSACRSTQRGLGSNGALLTARHLVLIDNDSLAAYVSCVGAGWGVRSHGHAKDHTDDKRDPETVFFHLRLPTFILLFILHRSLSG
jgi:hypothetical protein